jgi:hypothetical protein
MREGVTQMAWESRNGRGRYYTRSRREHGRVVREYVGCGPVAELLAERDRRNRADRDERCRADRLTRQTIAAQDASLSTLHEHVEALAKIALLAAGFHCHKGEWRRCHG